jgi:hypothetical protein
VNRLRLPRHVVHQQILAERVGRRKVGFAPAHLRHFLDELHQPIVRRQHEGIDQHARPFALRNFFKRLADHQRIEAERVLVNAPVLKGECGGLAVGDHDDLLHILALALQDALCHTQALARVRVVRPDFYPCQLRERDFFRGIVK